MLILSPERCACPIKAIGPSMAGSCGTASQVVLFMTLLEGFINGRCDLADPCNRVQSQDPDESYDFVVVGAGAAGAVVAAKLSENPQWKVLLIEAGGDEPTAASVPAFSTTYWYLNETDWNYYTEPQENACLAKGGKCFWTRGKMLGGCTVTNGMIYMRGRPAIYDSWNAQGAKGWSWKDVFPEFLKSEDNKEIGTVVSPVYHSQGGPMPVRQFNYAPEFAYDILSAGVEIGYQATADLNAVNAGFAFVQSMIDNGSRYSTARAYLRPASHRPNLHVLLKAQVSRVIVNPVSKVLERVEYIIDGETRTVDVRKEAILSSGTLNSPQILLLSGIGPKETLEKFAIPAVQDLPGVGQNLHNHVGVNLDFTLTKEADVDELNWKSAVMYLLNREGPLSAIGITQATAILNSRYAPESGDRPDLQFFLFKGYDAKCGSAEIQDPYTPDRRTITISVINTQPRSRGYLTLRSTDPLQAPVMQPNYFLDQRDMDIVLDGARIAYRLANASILKSKYGMVPKKGYASECGENSDNPTDEYLKCIIKRYTAPENHQAGTCKIGPADDPLAVVDSELKVYGIQGLRVADASVMPTVVDSNTAATVIMIGERAAEFIKVKYRSNSGDFINGNCVSYEKDDSS